MRIFTLHRGASHAGWRVQQETVLLEIRIPKDEPAYDAVKTLFATDWNNRASGSLRTSAMASATRCCKISSRLAGREAGAHVSNFVP